MGVRVRLSRHTSAYFPFWAAILFWLIVGPVILAGWLLWALIQAGIIMVRAIAEHRQAGRVTRRAGG